MTACKSLYILCLEFCVPRIENYSRKISGKEDRECKWIENLAGPIIEDLLNYAFKKSNNQKESIKKIWKDEWKIFFTPKLSSAIINWDDELINYISNKCKNLQKCEVVQCTNFNAELILKLPRSVAILDFDGELIKRGKLTKPLLFEEESTESWLPHSEKILKAMQILQTLPSDYSSSSTSSFICDLHLGTAKASSSDLKLILLNCPNLRLLRHYQMVTALYELHSEAWKAKKNLPKYKLRNLDVDFSHVVRCRMSPGWVLAPNALQLAVALCPSAYSIRVRFDCSTPHDVLIPLTGLSKVKDFSAVCVSSGERTLLDFNDIAPIIEKHGPNSLTYVELKVIEEIEIHVIIEHCTKLETLILSGCGFVTPSTCSSFGCHRYRRGSFEKLRFLFYADGDDFSWDHGVPDCFWKASLCPSGKFRESKLQGVFLEFPRMPQSLIKEIFHSKVINSTTTALPFPKLEVLSLCRFEEITVDDVASTCGLSSAINENLKYVRLSNCESVTEPEEKRLRRWLKNCKAKLKIDIDR